MADLVGFHRREAKPAWWAFFDRQERSAEELAEDADCLGGCVADGEDWIGREKRSFTFRYRYPEQETKLTAGSSGSSRRRRWERRHHHCPRRDGADRDGQARHAAG